MKIRALRLANIGTFAAPTAVEGLSGGLDVLVGPNEMGKSTLFKALRTLFTEKHTTTAKIVDALRARDGGGEPVVEADFDTGGAAWRITKRFGRGRSASLLDRATGRLVAEGPEAEDRLAALVTREGGASGGLSLLWAAQGAATEPAAPDADAQRALNAAIEREVASAAGGGAARLVGEAVKQALDRHMTPTRRGAKTGSDYDRAVKRQAGLVSELAAARNVAAAAAERLRRMLDLRDELEKIDGAEAAATRKARARETAAALEGARAAAMRVKAARGDYEAAARAAERAAADLAGLDRDLAQLAAIAGRGERAAQRRGELVDACGLAENALEAAQEQGRLAAAREAKAIAAATACERREARLAAGRELEQATRTHAAATALTREIASARAALAALPAGARAVGELEDVTRDIEAEAARLGAGAPGVRVDYEPETKARILVEGRALADGEEMRVSGPLVLEIPGVGRIAIAPAASRERDAAVVAVRRLEERRDALLAALGVGDLAGARAALVDRQAREQALHAAEARFSGLVGAAGDDGLALLASRIATLQQRFAAEPEGGAGDEGTSREACALEVAAAREEVRARSAAMAEAVGKRATLRAELAACEAEVKRDGEQGAEIEARLPAQAVRAEERARRAGLADATAAKAREAQGVVAALVDTAPDAAALAGLEEAARRAAGAEAEAQARAGRLREEIALLEGEQRNADEQGIGTRVTALEGELTRADADVQRFRREVDELQLIAEALAAAEAETRDNLLGPVLQRIAPYLGLVFPDARLGFGAGFAPLSLERAGVGEVIGVLSRGTQEQLAILIRLGFGRLLAEAGHAVPLVLDDALVYSDDERIARMFAALALAAESHQVLVLTCRAAVFSGLGGTRLKLTPWLR